MLLSGCSLDAFFLRKPYFSCRSLLLSTSVLNDTLCILLESVLVNFSILYLIAVVGIGPPLLEIGELGLCWFKCILWSRMIVIMIVLNNGFQQGIVWLPKCVYKL